MLIFLTFSVLYFLFLFLAAVVSSGTSSFRCGASVAVAFYYSIIAGCGFTMFNPKVF